MAETEKKLSEDEKRVLEKKASLLASYLTNAGVEYISRELNTTHLIILKFHHYAHFRIDVDTTELSEDMMKSIIELKKAAEIFKKAEDNLKNLI